MSGFFPATAMPDREWWGALWPDPEGVLEELGAPRGDPAVDLCCGDGYFTAPMSRLARPSKVYALDLDARLVETCPSVRRRTGRSRPRGVRRGRRDVSAAPCSRTGGFRAARQHLPRRAGQGGARARGVRKVLAPGGKFAMVNWYPAPREETPVLGEPRGPATEMRLSPQQTRAQVEPAGFELEKVADLPPYHYGAVFVLHV